MFVVLEIASTDYDHIVLIKAIQTLTHYNNCTHTYTVIVAGLHGHGIQMKLPIEPVGPVTVGWSKKKFGMLGRVAKYLLLV